MNKKILIIDDDKFFSKVLKDSLCSNNGKDYIIINTYDGEEGLIVAKKEKPDLIISDLMMPKMGGIEFIKKLKLENSISKTPIIISTQMPDMDKISEATELGIKGYIVKSDYTLKGIAEQVNDILKKE